MVYSSVGQYYKKAAHYAVEISFPDTAAIATATAVVSWYTYQVGMTYSQAPLTRLIVWQMGYISGYLSAPLIVPWLAPIVSTYSSLGAAFVTSIVLNTIFRKTLRADRTENQEKMPQKTFSPSELEIEPPPPLVHPCGLSFNETPKETEETPREPKPFKEISEKKIKEESNKKENSIVFPSFESHAMNQVAKLYPLYFPFIGIKETPPLLKNSERILRQENKIPNENKQNFKVSVTKKVFLEELWNCSWNSCLFPN